jgi:hypothetical protein
MKPICFYDYATAPANVQEKITPCKYVALVPATDAQNLMDSLEFLRFVNIVPETSYFGTIMHDDEVHRIFAI